MRYVFKNYKLDIRVSYELRLIIMNSITGKTCSVKVSKKPKDMNGAMLLFADYIRHVIMGRKSFDDFCNDYGYVSTNLEHQNLYKQCVTKANAFSKVCNDINSLYSDVNKFLENYGGILK